ncbi:transporter substrate-binding domain-containing protein [Aeromonas sp. MR19]|uniref:substrate-binding periplasmic protein n=1 Tax=Aeromonas TaxID=642 RepID=UPI000BFE69A0|nr:MULTISPECIES: transporter substrate-binding domain-containing protein [Aeromonas]ATL98126.1 ABC transporter substrate-binding protein [Aeromonas sp. CA23]MCH7375983.1 transporter substrate-binding domain-containing protein [Aeromonas sp. MR19]MDM5090589.1 transporter substrate-binding domain-containing protein [Aeromonas bestiarum]POG22468.1 ABC transporter substrate-binding protein [Aeromonas bestiarum]HEH9404742.1 transporter substrate-binding domain-containing protein [Aeromonas bestiaru
MVWRKGWILICLWWGLAAQAAEQPTLTLLTELWPPYVMRLDDGSLGGADLELARTVLTRMGYRTTVKVLPWKRVLQEARLQQGDGIVDAFFEERRLEWLHYPDEPLSQSGEVIFFPLDKPVDYQSLASLKGLRVGTQTDYAYGEAFLTAAGFTRVPMTGESNMIKQLHLMMAGRLDAVVMNQMVGRYLVRGQGLQDQIGHSDKTVTDSNRNFLAFTHKPGHEKLAYQFSLALKAFKQTPEYQALLTRYGL